MEWKESYAHIRGRDLAETIYALPRHGIPGLYREYLSPWTGDPRHCPGNPAINHVLACHLIEFWRSIAFLRVLLTNIMLPPASVTN